MKKTGSGARHWRWIGVPLMLALAACGNDGNGGTTPTTSPTTTVPPTTLPAGRTILEGSERLPALQVFVVDVEPRSGGRLEITVGYTHENSQILLWLTDRKCSFVMFDQDMCEYLVKSLEGPRPRTISVPSVAAGTYTLFVANDGPNDESLTFEAVLEP